MALSDKDVDETMAADWAAIQEKYAPEPDDAPADPPAAAPDGGDPAPAKDETIPVSREADGKFKAQPKDKPARADKATPAAADKTRPSPSKEGDASATAEPSSDQPQARDINRAPSTWKPAARAEFDKLSPSIKAEIHRREADFLNGQAQLRPDAELGSKMREVIRPYEMMINAEGGTPERAVADLMRTAAILRVGTAEQKMQVIIGTARQFGVDLRAVFNPQAAPAGGQPNPQTFRDPRVDQILQHQQQEQQQRVQRETQERETTVTRWMNEMDAQGNPKRPYLGDVINEMSALVAQIRQTDPAKSHVEALNDAYDRAIWAHPEIRTLLAQKQQADLDAQRRSDNQTRVRDARRAGSVNVPRRGSTPAPGKPGKMEDTIAEAARALGMIS